jgi:hypothetical protein
VDDDAPEQFSPESREALAAATERLVTALRAYATDVGGLRGGSADMAELFTRNAALEQVVLAWDEAVFDHTGTTAVTLLEDDDEDEDDAFADAGEEITFEGGLTVVSRWDLGLVDGAALLAAGRAAHRRNRPAETAADAEVAVARPADALYAILHEAGEPMLGLPGVEPLQGTRWYIAPDEPPAPMSETIPDPADLEPPPGPVALSERW